MKTEPDADGEGEDGAGEQEADGDGASDALSNLTTTPAQIAAENALMPEAV